jgi:hypothetical protein
MSPRGRSVAEAANSRGLRYVGPISMVVRSKRKPSSLICAAMAAPTEATRPAGRAGRNEARKRDASTRRTCLDGLRGRTLDDTPPDEPNSSNPRDTKCDMEGLPWSTSAHPPRRRGAAPGRSCRADRSAARNGHSGPSIFVEVRQARPDGSRLIGKRLALGSVWIQREFMTAAAILIMAAKL